jgi:hypothetical protein
MHVDEQILFLFCYVCLSSYFYDQFSRRKIERGKNLQDRY